MDNKWLGFFDKKSHGNPVLASREAQAGYPQNSLRLPFVSQLSDLAASISGGQHQHTLTKQMNKSKSVIVALALAGLAYTLTAQDSGTPPSDGSGQERPPMRRRMPPHPLMQALDANKDGTLDEQEIANAAVALTTLDKNGDGKLTPDELRPPFPPGGPGGPGFRRPPPDGQGGEQGQPPQQ